MEREKWEDAIQWAKSKPVVVVHFYNFSTWRLMQDNFCELEKKLVAYKGTCLKNSKVSKYIIKSLIIQNVEIHRVVM